MDLVQNITQSCSLFLGQYIVLDYSIWLYRLLMPLIVIFLLPFGFLALVYVACVILLVCKLHRKVILKAATTDRNFWDTGRKLAAAVWDAHARIYHGYEVVGIENLPKEEAALLVFYHGALPADMFYFVARVVMQRDRVVSTVGARFLFKMPLWGLIADAFKVTTGSVESCANTLNEGNLLAISPGGIYEAQFSDHYYELLWRNRVGFAKVALEAKVPIIPVFTQNIREVFRQVGFMKNFCIKMYNWYGILLRPVYGFFPVKLRTYVGKPIPYDPNLTPQQLQEKVASSMEELIKKQQRIPGNIFLALLDRFPSKKKRQ